MDRRCFLCNKPLPVEQRTTVFCSERCQERHRLLQGTAPPAGRSPRAQAPTPDARPARRPLPPQPPAD